MTRSVHRLVEELEALPEEEQEAHAASFLNALRRRSQYEEEEQSEKKGTPYSSFKVLREAELPGPEDASATYEETLYGLEQQTVDDE